MKKTKIYLCLLAVGVIFCYTGYAQFNAIDSLENILNQSNLPNNERVLVLLDLSDKYLSRNPDKSFEYSKKAILISNELHDQQLTGCSYRSLGNCYADRGDHDSSKFFLEKALKYIPNDALTYFFLGQNEWFNGNAAISNEYYVMAEKAAIAHMDLKTLAIVYDADAEYYRYQQQDSLAQHYISLSIRILQKSSFKAELAMAYNIQAEIYRTKGDYKNALETYVQTARIAYQILDSNRIGYCFSRMGYIYYMQNDFYHAEIYLLKGLELAQKVKGRNLKLFSLKALTDMYSNQANVVKCKQYASLCLQAGIELHDPTAEALAYSSLSNLFYRIHQNDSAILYANKAYLIAKANYDPINMLNAILNKVPLEFEMMNYRQVIQLSKEGIEIATTTETMEHLKDLYKYQYQAYEKMGNNADAFIAFKNFKSFEDSLQNTDVSLGLQKSQLEMGYQDKHLTDTLIYIANAQKAEDDILLEKQRSGFVILIGIVVTILLSTILFIIWITSQKRKKLNQSLAESNADKELLLKEIHHRVKNSLQTVSSLLNLQKGKSGLKSFDELIDESQVKINNVAIVHELLYQSSSFKKINLKDYIDKLTGHIQKTFDDEKKHIEIIKKIEPIEIGLEKSVPLALVINEIITNSFKYAFKDRELGRIEIICERKNENILVKISDNGIGLPPNGNVGSSIGIALIEGFVKQLKGVLNYGSDNGVFFVFSFPDNDSL